MLIMQHIIRWMFYNWFSLLGTFGVTIALAGFFAYKTVRAEKSSKKVFLYPTVFFGLLFALEVGLLLGMIYLYSSRA